MTDEQMARLKTLLRGWIVEEVARLPVREGLPGRDGRDGMPGALGERGPAGERGERGADGLQGRDGAPGERGESGPQGERGTDGIQGRDGAQGPQGPQGDRGERGADGVATIEEIDARIEARFQELQVRTLADSFRGVYRQGDSYARGETAQWGGSLFMALRATGAKPETDDSWVMLVKRGKDAAR